MRTLFASILVCIVCAGCSDDGSGTQPDAAAQGDAGADPSCSPEAGWQEAPPLPSGPTQETATVAVDGNVYVLGGFSGTVGVLDTVNVFDTETCTWSEGPQLPRAMHHINAAVVGGTIYVLGALEALEFRATGDVWSWTPGTGDGWQSHTAMPAGTERGAAVTWAIGDRVYVAGGFRGSAVADVSAYDTQGDSWDTSVPDLPQPRDHACGAAIDGTLYVAGGREGSVESISDALFALEPGGSWTSESAMPTARGGTACGVVDGQLIVVGGEGNPDDPSGVFDDAESYDAAGDSWDTLEPMPRPRHGMGAAAWNGTLYVPGGATQDGFGAVDQHDTFTP